MRERQTVHSGGETVNKPDSLISSIPSLLHVEKLEQSPELRASININLPVIRYGYHHNERTHDGKHCSCESVMKCGRVLAAAAEEDVSCCKKLSLELTLCSSVLPFFECLF